MVEDLVVVGVKFETGCILTTITVGVAISAIYKFIKDYGKFREGLVLLFKDLNGLLVRIRRSKSQGTTYLMREDIKEQTKLIAIGKQK